MKQLQSILDQLESNILDFEKTNPVVSQSTIGWQIDHSLLVINTVVDQLKDSNPASYKWRFKWIRIYIQISNKIPRGKVRAPKLVNPVAIATLEELQIKLELARKNITDISTIPANSYFTHPFFGDLKLKSALWFLKLHTTHHLKIIKDM
jgi:hypothetical protein